MKYKIEAVTWKNTGLFSGIKRLISSVIELEQKEQNPIIYFSFISKYYCNNEKNIFELLFKQNDRNEKQEYINFSNKITPFLNSGINNCPTKEQKQIANKIIKKYFIKSDKLTTYIDNHSLNIDIKDYIFVGFRGSDKIKETKKKYSYDIFWKRMKEDGKYFLMSEENCFIDQTHKRFDCVSLSQKRITNDQSPHQNIIFDETMILNLYNQTMLASECLYQITNISNTFDYISFLNPNKKRIIC